MSMTSTLRIYNDHFGLAERPFTLLPDPDFLYWSESHTRAYAMLEYGMLTHAPITVITGEIGAGKTTLLRHLLRSLPEEFTVGLISNAQGNRGELLHWVLMALGVPTETHASYVQLFAQFQDFLIEEYASGRRTMLIFDEAQNLEPRDARGAADVLQHQRRQGRADPAGAGRPAGAERPDRASRGWCSSRSGWRRSTTCRACPPTRSQAYIAHRLAVAGASREIFTPAAVRMRASRRAAACRGWSTRSATTRWSTPSPTGSTGWTRA